MADPFLFAVIRRDVLTALRERWGLLLWIAIPLVIGGMLSQVVSGPGGPAPVAELLLVDQDQSLVSELLGGAFGQGQLAELVNVTPSNDPVAARERMDAGEASALLIIPAGFGEAVLLDEPVVLTLVTNPSQRILPGIIQEVLEILVQGEFYLHRVFGPEISSLSSAILGSNEPDDLAVADLAVSINQAVDSVADYLMPPLIGLAVETPEVEPTDTGPSYMILLFPGIVLMALMFAAQSLSNDFWRERQQGTLRRLATTPRSLSQLTVGKAAAVAVLLSGVGGVVLTLGFLVLDLPWWRWPLAVIWQALGGVSLFAMMSVVALLAPSQRAASILTSLLLFPLLMIGGSFFPLEAMPDWLASVGAWTPNGVVATQLKLFLLGRNTAADLLLAMLGLLAAIAVLLGICRWRLTEFARGAGT
jgi:ABC-type multidrug transport system permease subunit